HTRSKRDWSSDVCSSDLDLPLYLECPLTWIALAPHASAIPRVSSVESSSTTITSVLVLFALIDFNNFGRLDRSFLAGIIILIGGVSAVIWLTSINLL